MPFLSAIFCRPTAAQQGMDSGRQLAQPEGLGHDVELLPGFTEGNWQDWPEQKMLDWLPAEICRQYGEIESSVLNGPFVRFDPSRTPNILEALERSGFHLRLDEKLVRTACGECSVG